MEFEDKIREIVKPYSRKNIVGAAKDISNLYRNETGTGKNFIDGIESAVAYAVSRMPATSAAILSCLNHIKEIRDLNFNSVYDFGAGTGAGVFAFFEVADCTTYHCFEKEASMIKIGEELTDVFAQKVFWKSFDIVGQKIDGKADFVLSAYVLGELKEEDRIVAIKKLYDSAKDLLLIVEPGTKIGFQNIKTFRTKLLSMGAKIVAPCTHEDVCPILGDDWCHFSVRLFRTSLHKDAKGGEKNFEDEKFSFICVSKNSSDLPEKRILRHPFIRKGCIDFVCCDKDAKIKEITISKKDGELYKEAKKKANGDSLNLYK